MFDRVIVPLDGSEESERALGYAVEIAHKFNAPVTLLRAYDGSERTVQLLAMMQTEPIPATVAPDTVDAVVEAAEAEGTEARRYLMRQLRKLAGQQLTVNTVVLDSPSAEAILEEARRTPGTLIVMATHARRGLERLLFGSVADEIVRRAHVPVLLVRTEEPAQEPVGAPGTEHAGTDERGRGVAPAVEHTGPATHNGNGRTKDMDVKIGADVIGREGKLGDVHRVIIDERSGKVTDLVVKHGFIFGGERVIPLGHVTGVDDRGVRVDLDEKGFEAMDGFAEHVRGVDPDYIGPPDMDADGVHRGNAAFEQAVAAGPLGAITAKPLGYPGGEALSPDPVQRPAVSSGIEVLDIDGEKIGSLGELCFKATDGTPTRITVRQGVLFKHDADVPVEWVQGYSTDGMVLNVPKAEVEARLQKA
jgi:nucleotide-binding universal stress UspA family protein/uncharacterized protein YrrD